MKKKYCYIVFLVLCITIITGCAKEGKEEGALKVEYNIESGLLEGGGISYQIDGDNATVTGHYDLDMENIKIPDSINYENKDYPVTKIATSAFESDLSLVNFTAGANLTEIGDSAFYSCDTLKSADLAGCVQMLGTDAFGSCSVLAEVKGAGALKSISDKAFAACYELGSITIPKSIENIGSEVFADCESLKECNFEEGLSFIGEGMFTNCVSLTGISLPDSITTINAEAFWGCTAIDSLELPEGLAVIGERAFYDTAVKSLKLPGSITSVKFEMLDGMEELGKIIVPASKEAAYKEEFGEYGVEIEVY